MQIQKNISLASYSTMRLGGVASYLAEIQSEDDLLEALTFANDHALNIHITGGGSNTIFSDKGFSGLVIINKITGIDTRALDDSIEITCGAGEVWDTIVEASVSEGFTDIAALSLIPGSAGAAPVQNIGAYGQQISDSLISVRAYDTKRQDFIELNSADCNFSYRQSRFNTTDKNRFIITSIKLRLSRNYEKVPFYQDIANYFEEHGIDQSSVSPRELREATSTVRVIKLPDPSTVANSGSFFKNPVVKPELFSQLQQRYPKLKSHQTDDGNLKLYAGQLIELAGMKDYHDSATGMATWKNQALVVVNESAKTTQDLLDFKQKIIQLVQELFQIELIQEPEFIEN